MSPDKIKALADRIDYEELWRRAGMDRSSFTPEQKDRLDAGVELRRYADLLGSDCWRIYPPRPNLHYRASTLESVVQMARKDEARETKKGLT